MYIHFWFSWVVILHSLPSLNFQATTICREIEEIVQNILKILGPKFSSLPNDHLVGMESCVEELVKLLELELFNVV